MHCGSRKPSSRWQGKRDCGAHNATLKNLQHTTISPIEEGQHLARNAFKLHLRLHITPFLPTCSFGIRGLHCVQMKGQPLGCQKQVSIIVSGSLQLITENGREGISAASVHARILPSKSTWFIKKYNLYTNCLALPTCTHVDLRTSSRLYSFHSYLAALSLLMLPSVRVTALCPFLLYGRHLADQNS